MNKKSYFLGGITAKGFVYFYDNLVKNMDAVLYLDGGMTTINETIFSHIIEKFKDKHALELVHNHLEPELLEAIVIKDINLAIIDRTKMGRDSHLIFPRLREDLFYIGEGYDIKLLKKEQSELFALREKIIQLYENAGEHFKRALDIHHKVEQTYFKYMNIEKANHETKKLIEGFFHNSYLNKPSHTWHRYLGGATSKGAIDFILELTDDVDRRIFIKGRSGTGKSTMLKKIVNEAEKRGFDLEIYHCGFDPDSLDMVILRELGIAIFDATDPHSHNPIKTSDEIFDSFELFVEGDPDQEQEKISILEKNYKGEMKGATQVLAQVRDLQREFESIYKHALNESFLDVAKNYVDNWIRRFE